MLFRSSFSRLSRTATRFRSDERGSFSTIAAAVILAVLLTIGVALDYSTAGKTQSKLQNAIDAATLAATRAASEGITDEKKLKEIALQSLKANFPDAAELTASLSFDPKTKIVKVSATVASSTSFMKLASFEKIDVRADAEAVASGIEAEVSMVLDATGSMGGSKILNLQTAAKSLVDALLPASAGDDKIRVAMVPYAASVNVGLLGKSNVIKPAKNDWVAFLSTIFSILSGEGTSEAKWQQVKDYIASMKEGKAFTSNYTCVTERVGAKAFVDTGSLKSDPILDMTSYCPAAEVIPLTTNATQLKSEISNLTAGGSTAGHIGLGWGWYTLSRPMAKKIWPDNKPPQKYKDVLKILVLMTDGAFNTNYVGESSTSQTLKLCKKIKNKGVLIYSVGFQAPPSALTMLKQCATTSSMFFDAQSGAELEKVFKQIAAETKALRLSM